MTQFNVMLLEDEARVMTDTLGVRRNGQTAIIQKTDDLPGAVLVGRGGDWFFTELARLVHDSDLVGFDAITDNLKDLAWQAMIPRIDAMRDQLGRGTREDVANMARALAYQRDADVAWAIDYQLIVTGYSEREGTMLAAVSGFVEDDVQILRPPNIAGGQYEVLVRFVEAIGGVPSIEQQADALRLQYEADIQLATDNGFPVDPVNVGGGDIELTRITPDGAITRENLGRLVQEAVA